jgi:serine/threonine protein phosphatase PrpC
MSTPNDDTVDGLALDFPTSPPFSSLVDVDLAGLSHRGKRRPNNEDHFVTARFGRFLETIHTNVASGPRRVEEAGVGVLVADGMGGHPAGAQASEMAIHGFLELVLATPDWIFRPDDDALLEEIVRRAKRRFEKVNSLLTARAQEDPYLKGLGTTLTAAWSLGKTLLVAHVGNSRAYLHRGNVLHRLTRDHTLAQELANAGAVHPREVAGHRLRHILTKAVGDIPGTGSPDVQEFQLQDDDCLLLCSDGLTEMVDDRGIEEILSARSESQTLCDQLLDAALQAGGKDNVTVVIAQYRIPASGQETA